MLEHPLPFLPFPPRWSVPPGHPSVPYMLGCFPAISEVAASVALSAAAAFLLGGRPLGPFPVDFILAVELASRDMCRLLIRWARRLKFCRWGEVVSGDKRMRKTAREQERKRGELQFQINLMNT